MTIPVPGDIPPPVRRLVRLPGRGTAAVWECPGPPGAETLILLHGVAFTAELNWRSVFEPLGRQFRVVALDQRGHGDGVRAGGRFRLEDCADDVAVLASVLGIDRFIAVGYSMGGMVAQLLHRRHPSLVGGMVLCSTARNMRGSTLEQLGALALPTVAATMAWNPMVQAIGSEVLGAYLLGHLRDRRIRAWANDQLRRTSFATSFAAMRAVCDFSSHSWISEVDVPAAVIVTLRDRIVPASRQLKLARAIPGALAFELYADHGVCIDDPDLFTSVFSQACTSVAAAVCTSSRRTALTDSA